MGQCNDAYSAVVVASALAEAFDTDINGLPLLDRDEHMRADTTMQTLAALQPSFAMPGEFAFDAVAQQRYPEVEKINHVHHAGNSSGIVDGASAVLIGTKEMGDAVLAAL